MKTRIALYTLAIMVGLFLPVLILCQTYLADTEWLFIVLLLLPIVLPTTGLTKHPKYKVFAWAFMLACVATVLLTLAFLIFLGVVVRC